MKVCHFMNSVGRGGAETLVLKMIRHTEREDVSYTVCFLGGDDNLAPEMAAAGAETVDLGARTSPPQLDVRPPLRLLARLRHTDYDVVHMHMPYTQVLGRLAWSVFEDAALVSTQHIVRDSLHAAAKTFESLTGPLDSATVAVSEGVQRSFTGKSNRYDESGLDGRWCTIPNGIDVPEFNEAVEEAATEAIGRADGGRDGLTLLNVARYVPEKSQMDLVAAMDALGDRLPDSHLYLVGSGGPLEDDLRAEVRRRGLEDFVTVTGYVPDIHEYYAMADVFVSASLLEGLPVTQLEAMAAELPVVATDIPGVGEVVEHGETGYLVPPNDPEALADAMAELDSPTERRRFGTNGYRRAERHFDIRKMVASYLDLYDRLLTDSGPRRAEERLAR